jgi:hypothetical protein
MINWLRRIRNCFETTFGGVQRSQNYFVKLKTVS